jgi:serine protease AprX
MRLRTKLKIVPLLVGTFILAANLSFAQQPSSISPDLQGLDPLTPVNVIVQFNSAPSLVALETIPLLGGVVKGTLSLVNGVLVSLPPAILDAVAALPGVVYISPDRLNMPLLDNSAGAVNASTAWQAGWTGSGIGVAVIDSGISNHSDLDTSTGKFRVVYSQDFTSSGTTNDQYGHGEHVAGIVAGDAASSNCSNCTRQFRGIAPGASLINLRVLDKNGSGTDSEVISAIASAIALKSIYNIRVINLSLGRPIFESYQFDPLCRAVEAAWQAGVVVVVAAGNNGRDDYQDTEGYGTITTPGNDPYVITVGAMKSMGTPQRTDDLIASYSSKGPTAIDHVVKPDLVAPGNLVVSLLANGGSATLPQTYPQNDVPLTYYENTTSTALSTQYFTLNGTSMATPVVSGAVADLLQAQPTLTPDQVKARLMMTAYKTFPLSSTATDPTTGQTYTSYYDVFTVGAGYLDIAAALASTYVAPGLWLSPYATYNPTTGAVYLVNNPTSILGNTSVVPDRSVWGNQSVSGTQAVWGTQSVWGNQSVWGTQTVTGTRSVWGTQLVWGTRSVWGTSAAEAAEATMINGEQ